jgi:hypothetical protein
VSTWRGQLLHLFIHIVFLYDLYYIYILPITYIYITYIISIYIVYIILFTLFLFIYILIIPARCRMFSKLPSNLYPLLRCVPAISLTLRLILGANYSLKFARLVEMIPPVNKTFARRSA